MSGDRTPSAALLASLRLGEGCRLSAYPDPKSGGAPWTIAYGRAHGVKRGDRCTLPQAETWLREDAQTAVDLLLAKAPWTAQLDEVRFDVLAEMVFNMGWRKVDAGGHVHGLSGFVRTLGFIEVGDYQAGADGMLASGWAKDVGARGVRLAHRMRTGAAA